MVLKERAEESDWKRMEIKSREGTAKARKENGN